MIKTTLALVAATTLLVAPAPISHEGTTVWHVPSLDIHNGIEVKMVTCEDMYWTGFLAESTMKEIEQLARSCALDKNTPKGMCYGVRYMWFSAKSLRDKAVRDYIEHCEEDA